MLYSRFLVMLRRGVRVRAIVDREKYATFQAEQDHLATYLTGAGGELHISNPIFPRSFPKLILIDDRSYLVGSACLDELTFTSYRDFAIRGHNPAILRDLSRLFESDWAWTSHPRIQTDTQAKGQTAAGGADQHGVPPGATLTAGAPAPRRLLGTAGQSDPGERAGRGGPPRCQGAPDRAPASEWPARAGPGPADRLAGPPPSRGVIVHTSGPGCSPSQPYMHARVDILDGGRQVILGSISLAPDSVTFNREVGLLLTNFAVKRALAAQFEQDFLHASTPYTPDQGRQLEALPNKSVTPNGTRPCDARTLDTGTRLPTAGIASLW